MAEKMVKFLVEALGVVMDESAVKALTSTIEATFTDLKEKSLNGSLYFSKSSDGHNLSCEYRIRFAFPNPDLPDYFHSLVTTMKLEADMSSESDWWGLVGSSSKSFSSTIDAMKLVVVRGFKCPK
jgi:hypothetical protein